MPFVIYLIRVLMRSVFYAVRSLKKPPHYVVFTLEGRYADIPPLKQGFFRRKLTPRETSIKELGEQFEHVACDRRVRGVILHISSLKLSIAQLQTLRGFMRKLRQSDKHVVALASNYDMATYYVAAAANEILITRGGSIIQLGISRGYVFLADALERVGLKGDFVQISPYKTAPDMLTKTEMSEEARKMANWLLDDTYKSIIDDIAKDRGTSSGQIKALIDGAPYTDKAAKESGAIDGIVNQEQLPERLATSNQPAKIIPYDSLSEEIVA